jgi:uncharacterized protein
MQGETDLQILLKTMRPQMNAGEYVFCAVPTLEGIDLANLLFFFKENEAVTVVLRKEIADQYGMAYGFVAAWITLTVHSALEAVGLTAAFSNALAKHGIICNVVAAYYHDHIFVGKNDAQKAMEVLAALAKGDN